MTNYEKMKNMSIDEMAKTLWDNGEYDGSPWSKWFDEKYCQNCESVMVFVPYLNKESECTYCEIHDKCKFFPEKKETISCEEIIKLWLEQSE